MQPLAEEQPGAARPVDLRCLMKAAGNGLWRSSNADKTEEVLRVIDLASVEMEVCLHTYADGAKRLYIYGHNDAPILPRLIHWNDCCPNIT